MKFTVLLLRPDYIASNFGQDTYLTHVEANTVEAAVSRAQTEACVSDEGDNALDYYPLAVFHGHLDDISPGA